jgi:hypothetical protein
MIELNCQEVSIVRAGNALDTTTGSFISGGSTFGDCIRQGVYDDVFGGGGFGNVVTNCLFKKLME